MKKLRDILETVVQFDPIIIFCAFALTGIGFVVINSATLTSDLHYRQLMVQGGALVIGLFLMILFARMDFEFVFNAWKIILGGSCLLLLIVLFIGIGRSETGTAGWVRFGLVGIQPAEIVKIGFIITLSKHLSLIKDDINYFKNVILVLAHLFVMVFLILLQPDFGTAMVFVFIFAVLIFISGIDWRYIGAALAGGMILAPLIYFFVLGPIQKSRILVFLNPGSAPMGKGYQSLQSKIAIGSGRILGKGIQQGTQTQLGYLPEDHTDFIYAVIGEELGFIGCLVVILLFLLLILRCFYIAKHAKNDLGMFLAAGVGALIMAHTIENIGMTVGLMPITGIPLPFVSYGGSALLTYYAAIGIVLNIRMNRRIINF